MYALLTLRQRHRDRQTETETHRQTDRRQTDRQTDLSSTRQASDEEQTTDEQSRRFLPATNDVKLINQCSDNTFHTNELQTYRDGHRDT